MIAEIRFDYRFCLGIDFTTLIDTALEKNVSTWFAKINE